MYSKIIIGYDDSDQAKDALALARRLAESTGAELVAAHVSLVNPLMTGEADAVRLEHEDDFAARIKAAADAAGATFHDIESTSPGRGLHELAEEIGADLVVVGSSQHGRAGQTLLGNVAGALMHGGACAVAVAPQGYREGSHDVSSIVVGYDGLPEAELALQGAYDLARATGAPLKVVAVAAPPTMVVGKGAGFATERRAMQEAIEEEMSSRLTAATASVPGDLTVEANVVSGEPVEALLHEVEAPGTILVVGSRAYGPVRRVLLGSVSRALAGSSPAPLIVYPRGVHAERITQPHGAAGTTA